MRSINANTTIILVLLTFLAGAVTGWLLRRPSVVVKQRKWTQYVAVRDTVVVRDTIRSWRLRVVHDTVVEAPAMVVTKDTFLMTQDNVVVFDTVVVGISGDSVDIYHGLSVFGDVIDSVQVVREPVPVFVPEDRDGGGAPPVAVSPPTSTSVGATFSLGAMDLMVWHGGRLRVGGGGRYDFVSGKVSPVVGVCWRLSR